ncbi:hypothetical protein C8A06_0338 [Microbacteriaceae bacterium MWH-Ta3]|nr:hypothetical protein C8A06_0338 [Microbacteriaceae bacterium MWH-Ta3]
MAGWGRSLLSKFSKEPAFSGLPQLSDDVNDNAYLAAAAKAGESDRASGAYDEYLFTDNAQVEMPFERAVDEHLKLVTLRLRDRWRRVFLQRSGSNLDAQSRLAKASAQVQLATDDLNGVLGQIEEQQKILAGEMLGQHELNWAGSRPLFVSRLSGLIKVFAPTLTFLLIGIVDLGIIYVSLDDIPGFTSLEAALFTMPALAVQLVFPHLIGQRLNWDMRDHPKRLRNRFELTLLALLWLAFLIVMTQMRVNFIYSAAVSNGRGDEITAMVPVLALANLLMLLGLGGWILFEAARSNPHQHELLRLYVRRQTLDRRLKRAMKRQSDSADYIEGLTKAAAQAHLSFDEAVQATEDSLRYAAKSVYRRSLVNSMADAKFTAAYLEANREVNKREEVQG